MGLISPHACQLYSFRNYLQEISKIGTIDDENHFCAAEAYRIVCRVLDILIDIKATSVISIVLDFFEIINREFYLSNLSMFNQHKINEVISKFFTGITVDCSNHIITIDIKTLKESMTNPSKI